MQWPPITYTGIYGEKTTCPLEVGTQLEPLPDAALRVRRECLLDLLHLDSPRGVLALQEQAVDEHLEKGDVYQTLLIEGAHCFLKVPTQKEIKIQRCDT